MRRAFLSHLIGTMKQRTRFTVSIEGNIGSGKSTLLDYFSSSPAVECLREPVEKWCDLEGTNPLFRLYEDPARWSFSFNMYAMLTRLEMHKAKSCKPVRMLERSMHSNKFCFVENSYKEGNINSAEYGILNRYYNFICNEEAEDMRIDLYVYLRAPPSVCYERIRRRSRAEEDSLPFSLIENLHSLHEGWLRGAEVGAPVLTLDASKDLVEMKQVWEEKRDMILCGYDSPCITTKSKSESN